MNIDEWIAQRIFWKARKFSLPKKRTCLFADLPKELSARVADVAAESEAGRPVLAFVDSDERWTLLATRKVVSFHGGRVHACRLDCLSNVGPRDDCPSEATSEEITDWKLSWEYLRVCEGTERAAEIWVPCGNEAFALWNTLRMFPEVCHPTHLR